MLKRINVHLDTDTLEQLDKLNKKLAADDSLGWGRYSTTRADLIRYAIGHTFGVKIPNIHYCYHVIDKLTKKIAGEGKKKKSTR